MGIGCPSGSGSQHVLWARAARGLSQAAVVPAALEGHRPSPRKGPQAVAQDRAVGICVGGPGLPHSTLGLTKRPSETSCRLFGNHAPPPSGLPFGQQLVVPQTLNKLPDDPAMPLLE